jgi:hypothetical protein
MAAHAMSRGGCANVLVLVLGGLLIWAVAALVLVR